MILREIVSLILISAAIIIGIIGYASSYFLGDDNKVEEACESVIKSETGLDVDLSPGSAENVTLTEEEQPTAVDICDLENIKQS